MPLYGFSGIPIVTTDRIADNAITESKIQDNAISTAKIRDGAITTNKIADNAITTSKIANNAITTDKLADNVITTNKIADNAITLSKLSGVVSESPAANKIPVANTYGEISYNWFKPERTVYVDWYYGDDNNPGTSTQPFKTLQKAIDSAMPSGSITIHVLSNYTLDNHVRVSNKNVFIIFYGELKTTWHTITISGQNYDIIYKFSIINSWLTISSDSSNFRIIIPDRPTNNLLAPLNVLFAIDQNQNGFVNIRIRRSSGNSTDDVVYIGKDSVLFGIHHWSADRPALAAFALDFGHYVGRVKVHSNAYILRADNAPCTLYYVTPDGTVNENNQLINPATKIAGIVRDTNGIPRNIISNLII